MFVAACWDAPRTVMVVNFVWRGYLCRFVFCEHGAGATKPKMGIGPTEMRTFKTHQNDPFVTHVVCARLLLTYRCQDILILGPLAAHKTETG